MNIKYKVGKDHMTGKPTVQLMTGAQHIGTIWGEVDKAGDEFEREHGIIGIKHNSKTVAVIWGASEEVAPKVTIKKESD